MTAAPRSTAKLVLKAQEIPLDCPASRFMFQKPVVATREAWNSFGPERIFGLYLFLREQTERWNGLDYLQVFEDYGDSEAPNLWFIEDGQVVTALLPSDY